MPTTKADLLMHPVRLRIVLEASAGPLTAGDLAQRLPDVAQATLYRHLATLADAGVLDVVSERRVRGGVERTFRLVPAKAGLGSADAASLTPDEHLAGFTVFVTGMIAAFERYIRQPEALPGSDPVGYRQTALRLSDDEVSDLVDELTEVVRRYSDREAAPGRRTIRLSVAVIPDAAPDVRQAPPS